MTDVKAPCDSTKISVSSRLITAFEELLDLFRLGLFDGKFAALVAHQRVRLHLQAPRHKVVIVRIHSAVKNGFTRDWFDGVNVDQFLDARVAKHGLKRAKVGRRHVPVHLPCLLLHKRPFRF